MPKRSGLNNRASVIIQTKTKIEIRKDNTCWSGRTRNDVLNELCQMDSSPQSICFQGEHILVVQFYLCVCVFTCGHDLYII